MRTDNAGNFSVVFRISPDSSWTLLAEFPPADQPNWTWTSTSLVLPAEALSSQTRIGFRYDNEKQPSGGAAVDNIELFVSAMDVPDLVKPSGLRIFPVPSTGLLTVSFDQESRGDVRIRIMNLTGQTLSEQLITNFTGSFCQQFNLSKEPPGIYLVNIRSSSGEWNEKITLR